MSLRKDFIITWNTEVNFLDLRFDVSGVRETSKKKKKVLSCSHCGYVPFLLILFCGCTTLKSDITRVGSPGGSYLEFTLWTLVKPRALNTREKEKEVHGGPRSHEMASLRASLGIKTALSFCGS